MCLFIKVGTKANELNESAKPFAVLSDSAPLRLIIRTILESFTQLELRVQRFKKISCVDVSLKIFLPRRRRDAKYRRVILNTESIIPLQVCLTGILFHYLVKKFLAFIKRLHTNTFIFTMSTHICDVSKDAAYSIRWNSTVA